MAAIPLWIFLLTRCSRSSAVFSLLRRRILTHIEHELMQLNGRKSDALLQPATHEAHTATNSPTHCLNHMPYVHAAVAIETTALSGTCMRPAGSGNASPCDDLFPLLSSNFRGGSRNCVLTLAQPHCLRAPNHRLFKHTASIYCGL